MLMSVADKFLLYINPDLFIREHKRKTGKNDEVKNTEFKQMQAVGRATGRAPTDSRIAKAIEQLSHLKDVPARKIDLDKELKKGK